jgi:hypothetical protein
MKIRNACAADRFYPGTEEKLKSQLQQCYEGCLPAVNEKGPRKVLAVIAPHAGYAYSGKVAASLYSRLADDGPFETAIIIGPNHTGIGALVSLMVEGVWATPLGKVAIDTDLARKLCQSVVTEDDNAHTHEHSIEVQLPFLQSFNPEIKIVPICMMDQDLETARKVGKIISRAMEASHIIVATTDFTHFEPHREAMKKDKLVIEAITTLDEEKVFGTVRKAGISMCGYGPVMVAIIAAKGKGAKDATLVAYTTSGETTGDYTSVVGYGSMIIAKPQ